MLNCGECLVNKIKMVSLVDMVCPECSADYRGVTDFTVAAVVPRPDRNSAPKAPCAMQTPPAAKLASTVKPATAKPIPMIFEEKVITAITRLRAVALDAEYQGSSGQSLAWKIESIVADLESKELTEKDRGRLRTVDKIAEAVAKDAREAEAEESAAFPPVLSIGNGQDTVIFTPAEPAAA